MVRYDGNLPLGWLHPLLEDYRPGGLPATETSLDRILLDPDWRTVWRVPVGVTVVVTIGVLFWYANPSLFTSVTTRAPMGEPPLINPVVNTAAIVLATVFASRRGGLIGCWGMIYGPTVVLVGFTDPVPTAAGVLPMLIQVSATAWTAVEAHLIGVGLRWVVTDPPDALDRHLLLGAAESS